MKIVFTILIILVGFISCTKQSEEKKYNFDNYKSWKKPVKEVLDYPISGHGKTYRIIYANDISYKPEVITVDNKLKRVEYKDGSIIVKEVYQKREDIGKINPELTIMVKDSINPNAVKGWVYFVKHPNDRTVTQIQGTFCSSCHEAANDNFSFFDGNKEDIFRDYIFVPLFKVK